MTESISRLDRELAYIGFALLALPLLFVLHMTATYNVGLAYPLQSLVDAGFSSRPFELAGVLLLLGAPLLAAGVNLLAVLRVRFDRKDGDWSALFACGLTPGTSQSLPLQPRSTQHSCYTC